MGTETFELTSELQFSSYLVVLIGFREIGIAHQQILSALIDG
jgi:hypothetical protein